MATENFAWKQYQVIIKTMLPGVRPVREVGSCILSVTDSLPYAHSIATVTAWLHVLMRCCCS